nr:O-acetyl-ADP-ribose deacetylase [uncultured Stomatobaculum sp.]
MPLHLVRNDITKMRVDAIVNAANGSLLGGGGVDGCIHRAAGPELLKACKKLHGCETGQAKITKGYRLPCKYVIHAVGPRWQGGTQGEEEKLRSCYRESLKLAAEYQCETVAFPLISAGIYGYPKAEALRVAVEQISAFLETAEMTVYLVIFDRESYEIGAERFSEIQVYIDERYVDAHTDSAVQRFHRERLYEAKCAETPRCETKAVAEVSLEETLRRIGESFSEMLLRKIDEAGMTDAQCYKKANIDRKLFSKIRSDKHYQPSKATVVAFALALELPLPEFEELLEKAGFALSPASKFDLIVEYFVTRGKYNVFEINEALFAFDENPIGA